MGALGDRGLLLNAIIMGHAHSIGIFRERSLFWLVTLFGLVILPHLVLEKVPALLSIGFGDQRGLLRNRHGMYRIRGLYLPYAWLGYVLGESLLIQVKMRDRHLNGMVLARRGLVPLVNLEDVEVRQVVILLPSL